VRTASARASSSGRDHLPEQAAARLVALRELPVEHLSLAGAFLHSCFQCRIRLLDGVDRRLERRSHVLERAAEAAHFIIAKGRNGRIHLARCDAFGRPAQHADRTQDALRNAVGEQQAEDQQQRHPEEQGPAQPVRVGQRRRLGLPEAERPVHLADRYDGGHLLDVHLAAVVTRRAHALHVLA
jgi:hypothetical protein